MRKGVLLICCAVLWPQLTIAEPTPTIKGLMKVPVSLFEFGLYRLATDLDVSVSYDPAKNRIEISTPWDRTVYPSKVEAELSCQDRIAEVKKDLAVNAEDGKGFFKSSLVRTFFSPPSMAPFAMSEDAAQEIDNLVEVQCFSFVRQGETREFIQCVSMLRSSTMLCGEKKP